MVFLSQSSAFSIRSGIFYIFTKLNLGIIIIALLQILTKISIALLQNSLGSVKSYIVLK